MAITASSGMVPDGTMAMMAFNPPYASSPPKAPPKIASSRLSVSSCWMRRRRLAPREMRTAISFWREVALASNKLETFAHEINSSRATAPSRVNKPLRMPLGKVSLNDNKLTRKFSGNCLGSCRLRSSIIGRRSASACASVTPGLSRPRRWTSVTPSTILLRSSVIGRYTSAPRHMNGRGMTPTMVRTDPFKFNC